MRPRRPGGASGLTIVDRRWGEPMDFVAHECPHCGGPIQWSAGRQRYVERGGMRDGSAHVCPVNLGAYELVACYCGTHVCRYPDGRAVEWNGRRHDCPLTWPVRTDEEEDEAAAPAHVAPRLPGPKPLPRSTATDAHGTAADGGVLELE